VGFLLILKEIPNILFYLFSIHFSFNNVRQNHLIWCNMLQRMY